MAGVEVPGFSAPDETRTPEKTTVELVNLADGQIGLGEQTESNRRILGVQFENVSRGLVGLLFEIGGIVVASGDVARG